jgi:predicted permease
MSMLFNSVIPSVAPVFLIILFGYLIGRRTSYDLKSGFSV